VFSDIEMEIRRGDRIALTGENGSGKTTLLKILTKDLLPESGELHFGQNLTVAYFAQHQLQLLNPNNTLIEEISVFVSGLTVTQIRSYLGNFLFSGDDVDKKIKVLSGGEKSRIVLLKMLLSKANFLIMDEPTNHLDMESREVLAEALDNFKGTILLVSHDRFFLDMLVSKIYHFDKGNLEYFVGNYSEFEIKQAESTTTVSEIKNIQPKENPKEKKRREAEERQKKFALKKESIAEVKKLDVLIKKYGSKIEDIEEFMAGEKYLLSSVDEKKEMNINYQKLNQELENFENHWLELSEQIENVDNLFN
ncbi:MAG: ABC-F family ATP-binding cassette domain-containing protein, partial [Candidatus Marinimicrobia bacterium]|nr:ABC-F family ATP-binding cassette domain-containing protein [Candidatus Neomarinimicrobiota bacterium]